MKKIQNRKHQPLPGTPEARPDGGGRAKRETATPEPEDGVKSGKQAECVADDDGMPARAKGTRRSA